MDMENSVVIAGVVGKWVEGKWLKVKGGINGDEKKGK